MMIQVIAAYLHRVVVAIVAMDLAQIGMIIHD